MAAFPGGGVFPSAALFPGVPPRPAVLTSPIGPEWLLSTRGADGRLTGNLPVKSLSAVTRHLGVGAGTATVPYSRSAYERLTEGAGVRLLRNGVEVMTGFLTSIEEAWPADTIKVAWVSEQVLLSDHLVIPDPAVGITQTIPNWVRSGVASTVMTAMLAEQMGSTANALWRVPGLTVGPDPVVGATVSVSIRYGSPDLLAELVSISANSGADLGVRLGADLVAQVVAPVESAGKARFSADLGNLMSYSFTRTAPKVTGVISHGTSTAAAISSDPITTAWGRRIWTFKQASGDDLTPAQVAAAELPDGAAQVALTCTLRDTPRLRFGVDWGLGHRVTVYVGRPGEPKTEVVDVVREVAFEYGTGGEKITPAIGSAGASALPTLPSRQTLNKIRARLAGMERSN
jgi:hypothetical protein